MHAARADAFAIWGAILTLAVTFMAVLELIVPLL